jgi:hypothetical protein
MSDKKNELQQSDDPVSVKLENPPEVYYPGDTLTATYQIGGDPLGIRELEVSVLWRTEGKGDEDLGVHFYETHKPGEEEATSVWETRRITTRLPASPLSYDGVLVKIRWCVRVRATFQYKDEWLREVPFQLGDVAAAREVPT